jgi:hypothetical protein
VVHDLFREVIGHPLDEAEGTVFAEARANHTDARLVFSEQVARGLGQEVHGFVHFALQFGAFSFGERAVIVAVERLGFTPFDVVFDFWQGLERAGVLAANRLGHNP